MKRVTYHNVYISDIPDLHKKTTLKQELILVDTVNSNMMTASKFQYYFENNNKKWLIYLT